MKRILILLFVVGMLLCLFGCKGQQEQGEVTTGNQTQITEPEATEEPEVETVPMPDIEMPTQPGADYQLPPGEKPGGEVITE